MVFSVLFIEAVLLFQLSVLLFFAILEFITNCLHRIRLSYLSSIGVAMRLIVNNLTFKVRPYLRVVFRGISYLWLSILMTLLLPYLLLFCLFYCLFNKSIKKLHHIEYALNIPTYDVLALDLQKVILDYLRLGEQYEQSIKGRLFWLNLVNALQLFIELRKYDVKYLQVPGPAH